MELSTSGVIGTAGHIDHGKTALVRALTGIDTDRLKEEKLRGITIELGFAHLALPSGRSVGVVDVPGHERFVRTMVAGAVGIDLVVLVVAADEGVMPQTREHLDICQLLGVRRGVVALTKIDAVDEDMRGLAESDVRDALRGTFLEAASIVRCSAHTREGLDALVATIDRALDDRVPLATLEGWPAPVRIVDAEVRLPIDREFTMKGFGSVVTGTLWSGRLRLGDEVELLPDGARGKVRGLQQHGGAIEQIEAGHRAAVNVTIAREQIVRGSVLAHAGALAAGRVFDGAIRLLPTARRPLKRRTRALLHAGTTQVDVTVRLLEADSLAPGDRAHVEIESTKPLVVLPGDRFVLRGFEQQKGYGTTIGGGVVARVLGKRGRRGAPTDPRLVARNLEAQAKGDVEARVVLEIERAGERGIDRPSLTQRLAASRRELTAALEHALSRRTIVRFDRERDAYVTSDVVKVLADRALASIAEHHRAMPLEPGMPRESLRAKVTKDARLLHVVIESLIANERVIAEQDRVRSVAHVEARRDDLGARATARLESAGLQPPRPIDLAAELAVDGKSLERALELEAKQGRLQRVQSLYFSVSAIDGLRARLVAYFASNAELTPTAWKELCGASRKFTIPLAEHFDAEKVTLRVGDNRRLRQNK